jgi:hypothetical protein
MHEVGGVVKIMKNQQLIIKDFLADKNNFSQHVTL